MVYGSCWSRLYVIRCEASLLSLLGYWCALFLLLRAACHHLSLHSNLLEKKFPPYSSSSVWGRKHLRDSAHVFTIQPFWLRIYPPPWFTLEIHSLTQSNHTVVLPLQFSPVLSLYTPYCIPLPYLSLSLFPTPCVSRTHATPTHCFLINFAISLPTFREAILSPLELASLAAPALDNHTWQGILHLVTEVEWCICVALPGYTLSTPVVPLCPLTDLDFFFTTLGNEFGEWEGEGKEERGGEALPRDTLPSDELNKSETNWKTTATFQYNEMIID